MDHVWGVHIGGIHAVLKDFKQISRRRITIIFLPKHENFLSKVSWKTFICVISWDFGQKKTASHLWFVGNVDYAGVRIIREKKR